MGTPRYPRTDYDRMVSAYDRGRGLSEEALTAWREAVSPYLDSIDGPVLDLGSGTGIFSIALARWLKTLVVGVEPSNGMREVARRNRTHQRVVYVGGVAEKIPLKDDSFAAAWLSTVVHHFEDLAAAIRELRRVVRPGGPVLVRNAFAGQHDGITWLTFFPEALRIADERWPNLEATVKAFSEGGFEVEKLIEGVVQETAPSLRDYYERVRTRTDSTLALLTDVEFAAGLRALEEAAARETTPTPVVDRLDLLVLR